METRHGTRRKARPTVIIEELSASQNLLEGCPPHSDIWNDGATSKLTHGVTQAENPTKFQPEIEKKKEKMKICGKKRHHEIVKCV